MVNLNHSSWWSTSTTPPGGQSPPSSWQSISSRHPGGQSPFSTLLLQKVVVNIHPSSWQSSSSHTVPKAFSRIEIFQNTPLRDILLILSTHVLMFFVVYFLLYLEHFRDLGGAAVFGGGDKISRYGRCCVGGGGQNFKIWEVVC